MRKMHAQSVPDLVRIHDRLFHAFGIGQGGGTLRYTKVYVAYPIGIRAPQNSSTGGTCPRLVSARHAHSAFAGPRVFEER